MLRSLVGSESCIRDRMELSETSTRKRFTQPSLLHTLPITI